MLGNNGIGNKRVPNDKRHYQYSKNSNSNKPSSSHPNNTNSNSSYILPVTHISHNSEYIFISYSSFLYIYPL